MEGQLSLALDVIGLIELVSGTLLRINLLEDSVFSDRLDWSPLCKLSELIWLTCFIICSWIFWCALWWSLSLSFLKGPRHLISIPLLTVGAIVQWLENNHIFHRTPWINDKKCSGSDPWIESRNLSKSSSNVWAYFFQSKFFFFKCLW